MSNHYETVFILNPVLSEEQIKEAVKKFEDIIVANQGEIVSYENWGLKKFAYPIANKKSGFYHLFEFSAPTNVVGTLETEFRRDERVMRFLTVALDKYGVAYAQQRREKIKQKYNNA